MLPSGSITPATRLVLTNAVYFKSKWKHQFKESATKTEQFYNSTIEIKTEIMHQTGEERSVCIAKDYAIYDLPFDSSKSSYTGAYVMRIVLPTINKSHPMNKRMELLESVEKQLSGDIVSNCKYEYFDDVLHKAFIEIDEKGGEAAAATAVVDLSESAEAIPPENYYFTVDHPFIYMIMEKSTGAAIFMGRVTDL